jgi:drug/metabolite transporter (DMT)-like permease
MNLFQSNQRQGDVFILLTAAGYSMVPLWVKTLQAAGLTSVDIATWRFILAVPLFWGLVVAQRAGDQGSADEARTPRLPTLRLLGMGLLLATAALTAFTGLEHLPAGTFVVLFYTYPAMVTIFSALMGERLSAQSWLALGLTSIGIILATPDVSQGLKGDNLPGVLLALLNAFEVAIYMLVSARLLKGHKATTQGSAWAVTGALLGFLVLLPFRQMQTPQVTSNWVNLIGLAGFSTVFTVFFLNAGIQKIGATRASILSTAEPIFTLILAQIFLGEWMKPIEVLGGAFILLSVILLQLPKRN